MCSNKLIIRIVLTVPTELEMEEEGTRIALTVVNTPGFGDQINNEAGLVLDATELLSISSC